MQRIRTFFDSSSKPVLVVFVAMVVLGASTFLVFWLREPKELTLLPTQYKDVQCMVWRHKVALQLASLRTKYRTDRDSYLFQHYSRLETTIKKDLNQCSDQLKGYRLRPFKRTLEALALQLLQRDEQVLTMIDDLESMFAR